ncbi:Bor family protein [Mucilaginibacter sp. SMC90]|uniref:Bor family protein n=1 Tax=Mucilaginibacter sp. SMC90 TaxID=2929803 RepID=UPI001FB1BEBA|nr:Bor family protein [Mucilaginibacter sp. SMC90]UOE48530.1 Bor family protein [Mucilaginibacter sp. SMC90]
MLPSYLKWSSRFYQKSVSALLLSLLLSSCYTARVETKAQAGSEVSHQNVNFFFWGAIQSPKRIVTPVCDSLGSNGMAEVTVKNNFGYSLLTVVTLGIWSPARVEWKCGKPCAKEGTIK